VTRLSAFWSYVHADDEHDDGLITQLARDLAGEVSALTGHEFNLFLDRDSLPWGADWRSKVRASLENAFLFVAIITPRYFLSPSCREELRVFSDNARSLGDKEQILPLHYHDVQGVYGTTCSDELVNLVRQFQVEDIRSLRYLERKSVEYRWQLNRLAHRLIDAAGTAHESEEDDPGDGEGHGGGIHAGGTSDRDPSGSGGTALEFPVPPGVLDDLESEDLRLEHRLDLISSLVPGLRHSTRNLVGTLSEVSRLQADLIPPEGHTAHPPKDSQMDNLATSRDIVRRLKPAVISLRDQAGELARALVRIDPSMIRILADATTERPPRLQHVLSAIVSIAESHDDLWGDLQRPDEDLWQFPAITSNINDTLAGKELLQLLTTLRQAVLQSIDVKSILFEWADAALRVREASWAEKPELA
jgi:hypothetical protein